MEELVSSNDGYVGGWRLRVTNNKSKIPTYSNRPVNKLTVLEITSKQSGKEPKITFVETERDRERRERRERGEYRSYE